MLGSERVCEPSHAAVPPSRFERLIVLLDTCGGAGRNVPFHLQSSPHRIQPPVISKLIMSSLLDHINALTGSLSEASDQDKRVVDDWVRYAGSAFQCMANVLRP